MYWNKNLRGKLTQFRDGRRFTDIHNLQAGASNVATGEAESPVTRTADQYFSRPQYSLQKVHIMEYDWAKDSLTIL